MLQHHHARLVPADRRHHVFGPDAGREAFGLAERDHGFVVAAELGERDPRQRMNQRQTAAVPGGVERRGCLRDVLADDREVADPAVALAELVVRQADRPRVVRDLRLLERASVEADGPRLIAVG